MPTPYDGRSAHPIRQIVMPRKSQGDRPLTNAEKQKAARDRRDADFTVLVQAVQNLVAALPLEQRARFDTTELGSAAGQVVRRRTRDHNATRLRGLSVETAAPPGADLSSRVAVVLSHPNAKVRAAFLKRLELSENDCLFYS
jgi:hypothetical protein